MASRSSSPTFTMHALEQALANIGEDDEKPKLVEKIRAIVAGTTKLNQEYDDGMTTIKYVARYGEAHAEALIRGLIDAGAQQEVCRRRFLNDGMTALMFVARRGGPHAEAALRALLSAQDADVHNEDIDGWTPLMFVARFGDEYFEVKIRALLAAGAYVDAKDNEGRTALMHAARQDKYAEPRMHVLIEAGADVNARDHDGWTVLMLAAFKGKDYGEAMICMLLAAGAEVNARTNTGLTALMRAAHGGGKDGEAMIRALLAAGADVNAQGPYGSTALTIAANHGGEYGKVMMGALLDAGADVNALDKFEHDDGATALYLAAEFGGEYAEEMVRLLVARGATLPPAKTYASIAAGGLPPNTPPELVAYVRGAKHWTPLHRAADARDADALRECLSQGARPDEEVKTVHPHMRTALEIAGSSAYPTARPVCSECLALLRPSLMKVAAVGGGGGGGGGGEGGAEGGGEGEGLFQMSV